VTGLLFSTVCALGFAAKACEAGVDRPSSYPSVQQRQEISPVEQLGQLEMSRHEYAAAISTLQTIANPSAEALNLTGVAYHHLFAFEQAKAYYRRALNLKPDFPAALNNMGAILYGEQRYKAAEKSYRRAIKLEPKNATVYKNLGTAFFADKKYSQGLEQYREAFRLDPEIFSGSDAIAEPSDAEDRALEAYSLARLFAEAGMDADAMVYLRKALANGFTDKKRLMNDQDFAGLRQRPEFAVMVAKL
jgi:tetratricopeptide (TPR) repeat protein